MKEIISQYGKTLMAIVIMGLLLLTVVLGPMKEQIKQWFAQEEEKTAPMAWEEVPLLEERGQTVIRLGREPMRAGKVLSLKHLFSTDSEQGNEEVEYYITDVTDDRNEKVLQILSGLTETSNPAALTWEEGRYVGFDEENQTLIIRKSGIYRITVRARGNSYSKRTFELMVAEARGGERT